MQNEDNLRLRERLQEGDFDRLTVSSIDSSQEGEFDRLSVSSIDSSQEEGLDRSTVNSINFVIVFTMLVFTMLVFTIRSGGPLEAGREILKAMHLISKEQLTEMTFSALGALIFIGAYRGSLKLERDYGELLSFREYFSHSVIENPPTSVIKKTDYSEISVIEKALAEKGYSFEELEEKYPEKTHEIAYCPISYEIMKTPVLLCGSGFTYDEKMLKKSLKNRPNIDPFTNGKIKNSNYSTNISVQKTILGYIESLPKKPNQDKIKEQDKQENQTQQDEQEHYITP